MIAYNTILATDDDYRTPADRRTSILPPTIAFYIPMIRTVFRASAKAKRGRYGDSDWVNSSIEIFNAMELARCRFHIEGMSVLHRLDGPAVFVSNHMSTLETFILPALINPVRRCTFVIKPSLIDYPVFGHVMRTRNPVVVSRDNPRQDLLTVMEQGAARIASGLSIVLFPQTTRRDDFDPSLFNSLGVKLARAANVPLLPIALKTNAWGSGRMFKDFGPIHPEHTIHIRFGEPLHITGNGRDQHEATLAFIDTHLAGWSKATK